MGLCAVIEWFRLVGEALARHPRSGPIWASFLFTLGAFGLAVPLQSGALFLAGWVGFALTPLAIWLVDREHRQALERAVSGRPAAEEVPPSGRVSSAEPEPPLTWLEPLI